MVHMSRSIPPPFAEYTPELSCCVTSTAGLAAAKTMCAAPQSGLAKRSPAVPATRLTCIPHDTLAGRPCRTLQLRVLPGLDVSMTLAGAEVRPIGRCVPATHTRAIQQDSAAQPRYPTRSMVRLGQVRLDELFDWGLCGFSGAPCCVLVDGSLSHDASGPRG